MWDGRRFERAAGALTNVRATDSRATDLRARDTRATDGADEPAYHLDL